MLDLHCNCVHDVNETQRLGLTRIRIYEHKSIDDNRLQRRISCPRRVAGPPGPLSSPVIIASPNTDDLDRVEISFCVDETDTGAGPVRNLRGRSDTIYCRDDCIRLYDCLRLFTTVCLYTIVRKKTTRLRTTVYYCVRLCTTVYDCTTATTIYDLWARQMRPTGNVDFHAVASLALETCSAA